MTQKHRKFIDKYDLTTTLFVENIKKMCVDFGVWKLKKFMGKEFIAYV